MIISSEITGKTYNSVEECLADEKAFENKRKEEERAQIERDKAITEAYEKAVKACEDFLELVGAEVDTMDEKIACDSTDADERMDKVLEDLISMLFK